VAVNPLTADTKPDSFAETVARRQLVMRGAPQLGKALTSSGMAAIAYGSEPVPLKRTSHLLPRDSIGKPSLKEPKTRFKSPLDNKWGANYERNPRANRGPGSPSTRTGIRSPTLATAGSLLVVAGRVVPVLGVAWVISDMMTHGSDVQSYDTVEAIKDQRDLNRDFMRTGISAAKAFYSNPIGKVATTVALSKLGF